MLWERLSSDTMDLAIKLHFTLLREAAAEHSGFEWSTEVWARLHELARACMGRV